MPVNNTTVAGDNYTYQIEPSTPTSFICTPIYAVRLSWEWDGRSSMVLWCFHTRARQRQDKTNVEPVHSYGAFHTRYGNDGVKDIIGMHRFNICLVVLSLFCSGVKTPLHHERIPRG